MHDLVAITALASAAGRVDEFEGLSLTECPDWALASLAARPGQEKELAAAVKNLLGMTLPKVGRCSAAEPFSAFWTGRDQWMIEAPHDSHEDLAAQVKAAVRDAGSVTEQTDGWVRFDLEGPHCHDVLELLCNADTRSMEANTSTRTRIEHLGCFLICRADQHFSVTGPRSSARSLHHAMTTAAISAI